MWLAVRRLRKNLAVRLVRDRPVLQVESHLLRSDRFVRWKSLRQRERRLRQRAELRYVPRHVAVPLGYVLLPTEDVHAKYLRLQR
jgi:hypothetical protein